MEMYTNTDGELIISGIGLARGYITQGPNDS